MGTIAINSPMIPHFLIISSLDAILRYKTICNFAQLLLRFYEYIYPCFVDQSALDAIHRYRTLCNFYLIIIVALFMFIDQSALDAIAGLFT